MPPRKPKPTPPPAAPAPQASAPPPQFNGLDAFKESPEFVELNSHRVKLLEFYGSAAFNAQQAFLDAMLAKAHEGAFAGRTVEVREEARALYMALKQVKGLPELLATILREDPAPAEGQGK